MPSPSLYTALLVICLLALALSSQADSSRRSATIYAWPLSASQPSKLAEISYTPQGSGNTIESLTPPSTNTLSEEELVRVGVYDPVTKAWRGTVTSASSFGPSVQGRLRININEAGDVLGASWHASWTGSQPGSSGEQFDVVMTAVAPHPVLNKPVMLSAEGKVAEPEVEKTMLQKYWWVLLGVAFLAMAGGGDK